MIKYFVVQIERLVNLLGLRRREEGGGRRDEGRGKREEGRGKREEGRG